MTTKHNDELKRVFEKCLAFCSVIDKVGVHPSHIYIKHIDSRLDLLFVVSHTELFELYHELYGVIPVVKQLVIDKYNTDLSWSFIPHYSNTDGFLSRSDLKYEYDFHFDISKWMT